VDKSIACNPFPVEITAQTHVEWVEWDLHTLERIIDAPRWRAVQASFYYLLYVELIGTLDRDRALKMAHKEHAPDEDVPMPRTKQLLSMFAFVAVPFFGFGFADNAIMILCGDIIDAQLGAVMGLSTLAAAALGNWISDVCGLGLGDVIERSAPRLGLTDGKLTPAQEKLQVAKFTTLAGKLIGISLGCFAGMLPLLFLTPSKTEFQKQDLEIYDTVFRPHCVSTENFARLMEQGTKRWGHTGDVVVQGGVPNKKVVLLLRGEVTAYSRPEGSEGKVIKKRDELPLCTYIGKLEKDPPVTAQDRRVPSRGSIIGGTAIVDESRISTSYPNDVVACRNVEWVEWDLGPLVESMQGDQAIKAAVYSMLYSELIQTLAKDSHTKELLHYRTLLTAVLADGMLGARERTFMEAEKEKLHISDEDHWRLLQEVGWTKEGWERGSLDGQVVLVRDLAEQAPSIAVPESLSDSVAQLKMASQLIDGVVQSMVESRLA